VSFKINTGGGKKDDAGGEGAKVLRMPPRPAPAPSPEDAPAGPEAQLAELLKSQLEPPAVEAPPRPELPPLPPLDPGIYLDITHDRYHADPATRPSLSSSIAQILAEKNAFKAWHAHPRLGAPAPRAGTRATNGGSILHNLVLGIGQEIEVVDSDAFRTKDAKAKRDAAIAAGKVPIVAAKFEALQAMAELLRARMAAKGVDLAGKREVTAIWERDGVLCRCRFDHLAEDALIIDDLKFTTDASPEAFTAKMIEYGYDIQWAAYVEAIETLIPEVAGRVRMRFVAVECNEDDPANEVSVIEPDGTMRELGARRWRRAKATWQRSLAAGLEEKFWPGYSAGVVKVGAPAWALSREMERQQNRMENDNATAPF
jgi:hypothetical protein